MILGIGIDSIEIARIKQSFESRGNAFKKRIAHPIELKLEPKQNHRNYEYWAARFAAKEAFAKALGTGIGKLVTFRSVGVKKDENGKPLLVFSTPLKKFLQKKNITNTHLAITHTLTVASAVVILESNHSGE